MLPPPEFKSIALLGISSHIKEMPHKMQINVFCGLIITNSLKFILLLDNRTV